VWVGANATPEKVEVTGVFYEYSHFADFCKHLETSDRKDDYNGQDYHWAHLKDGDVGDDGSLTDMAANAN
jgi:hypothetical protein